jgi:hypothetical protein
MRNSNAVLLCSVFCLAASVGTTACAPPPPPGVVYVARRPPGERVEVIGMRPGPGYVWVRGFWRWERDDYAWITGHWVLAERGFRDWVPGRWRHNHRGWYYVEGHWR